MTVRRLAVGDEELAEAAVALFAEEAGPEVQLQVLGSVHSWTWRYDDSVTHMLSLAFVASYLGGAIVPGDDMAGSEVRWATLDEIRSLPALIPEDVWIFERALSLFDLWVDGPVGEVPS